MHTVAHMFPAQPSALQSMDAKHFVQNFRVLIPCGICRRHFAAFIAKHPPLTSSGEAFFRWTVDLHNHVNKRNHKATFSYAQARAALQPARSVHQLTQVRKLPLRQWIQQGALRNHVHQMR